MTTSTCITHSAYCQLSLSANTKDTLAYKARNRANPLLKAVNNLMAFSLGCLIALGYGFQEMNHQQAKQASSSQHMIVTDQNR